jgi:antitoxin (DNA-binding transcriptional repressor) of toxin-antitoxin stability system
MKATVLDLRRRMPEVLRALGRNERVTLFHRGVEKGVIVPAPRRKLSSASKHPAFGLWRDRQDLRDPKAYVRALRRRSHAL